MKIGKLELFLIIFIVIVVAREAFKLGYDDTDSKEKGERSGMTLYIDYRTGLHYIKGGLFGTMIPRLDENGKQIREEI